MRPGPVAHRWKIDSMLADVLVVLREPAVHFSPDVRVAGREIRDSVDHVDHQMKTIEIVQHRHVERRGGGSLLLVSAHVKVAVIVTAIARRWIS